MNTATVLLVEAKFVQKVLLYLIERSSSKLGINPLVRGKTREL